MKLLRALLLSSFLWPAAALAQNAVYQPPTPIAQLNTTPGAPGSVGVGYATDQYLRLQVIPQGAVPLASLTELTPVPQVTVLPTALPTAFGTPFFNSSAASLSFLQINNGTNVDLWCDYGVGTPAPFTVTASGNYFRNWAANGRKMSGAVRCIHPSNTPSSGTVQIWGEQ